jgi:hypothetical protein
MRSGETLEVREETGTRWRRPPWLWVLAFPMADVNPPSQPNGCLPLVNLEYSTKSVRTPKTGTMRSGKGHRATERTRVRGVPNCTRGIPSAECCGRVCYFDSSGDVLTRNFALG